uniref:DUF3967 domain-containing protein n=1 Tax=Globodera pallida TaxID=36090 RepID=A0A183CP69_GLOPA
MTNVKNQTVTRYKEIIDMEKAARRESKAPEERELTVSELREAAEKHWEEQRRQDLNEDLLGTYREQTNMMM